MSSLYDLTGEFKELYELATNEEDQQAFLDTLEGLKGELEVKAGGYVHVIKQLTMEAEECDKVIEAFSAKKSARLNNVKRMKEALLNAMDAADLDTLKANEFTLKIANNGGVRPLKITGDVPDSFSKVIVQPDNDRIRKALVEGQELDFAHLEPRGRHLNIK